MSESSCEDQKLNYLNKVGEKRLHLLPRTVKGIVSRWDDTPQGVDVINQITRTRGRAVAQIFNELVGILNNPDDLDEGRLKDYLEAIAYGLSEDGVLLTGAASTTVSLKPA